MARGERTIQRYSPDFVISAGTQVVLKVSKALPGGEEHKKPGSVGVVVESPPNNEHPYIVQFADGQRCRASIIGSKRRKRRCVFQFSRHADKRSWHKLKCHECLASVLRLQRCSEFW